MSFLRAVRASILPTAPAPCQIGVDDWAWSKGKTYGTLIVDLQTHRPIDLLADRTADTFVIWLKKHPGIEIISRDRSGAYAEGAQLGAPQALQVADRFHLVKNLVDALEEFLLRKAPARAHAAQALATQHSPVPDAADLASAGQIRYRGRGEEHRKFAARHEDGECSTTCTARYPLRGHSPFTDPRPRAARDWSALGSQSQDGDTLPPAGGTSS